MTKCGNEILLNMRTTCIYCLLLGSAADICKAAMVQVEHHLAQEVNLDAKLLIQMHDELILEVKDQCLDRVTGKSTPGSKC